MKKTADWHHENSRIGFRYSRLIVMLSFLFCLTPFDIFSKELEVCKDKCNFSSIRTAVDSASSGDTIRIRKGIYQEGMISISKPLVLEGSNGVILDGKKEKHVLDIRSNNVVIRGLNIIGSGVSDTSEYSGVHAEKIMYCVIENNIFEDNAYAIYLAEVEDCNVRGNISTGNAVNEVSGGNGIHLWSSKGVRIEGNELKKHRDGIYLEFSSNLKIEDNFSQDNIRYGMHFMFSSDNDFRGNKFENNSAGVAVMYSKNILIENNRFENNWGDSSYGLLLKEISESILTKNLFVHNTVAIFADGCSRNYFTHNVLKDNGWGVRILGNSESNQFVQNEFKENVFDISTNTKHSTNSFRENFWDSYDGYDLDLDRFGDIPHKPVHFFGYWVVVYPFLMVLYNSPVVNFLQAIEKAFPIVTPIDLEDPKPKMRSRV
ncbi:nitrous oxide reductase family maturation protein NosD [Leptospira haakeii]|uniref:ABC transporter substrate-binding protein n=1 Tax=Leptospira haakeii TaxID=2023198 RepID=A0ABX4PJP4_9LEPT|nr:nitrous oxide reductase family maturation protein NosD [Leptospira haakeii]PKA15850.1 ABC transporter substrate-binding protein [Leptospira haakeii]PKA19370.1 ABC transporter substrate-binding protein [Leptospira haakeii]